MEKTEKSNKDKSHSKNNNNLKEQQKMEKSIPEPLEKQKKNRSHHKRKPNSERDKQKAELERSEGELKKLLTQFGSKAKVADDIDRDTSKLRDSIFELMAKAKSKSNNNTKMTAPHLNYQTTTTSTSTSPTLMTNLFFIIWNNLMSLFTMIIHPIQVLYQSYEKVYTHINWSLFLTVILLLELSIIGFIWKIKRIQYTYMYVEPYEAVVHGTFGVETTSWTYLSSMFDLVFDFFSEMRYGGRSFGSPSYDGFVPI